MDERWEKTRGSFGLFELALIEASQLWSLAGSATTVCVCSRVKIRLFNGLLGPSLTSDSMSVQLISQPAHPELQNQLVQIGSQGISPPIYSRYVYPCSAQESSIHDSMPNADIYRNCNDMPYDASWYRGNSPTLSMWPTILFVGNRPILGV